MFDKVGPLLGGKRACPKGLSILWNCPHLQSTHQNRNDKVDEDSMVPVCRYIWSHVEQCKDMLAVRETMGRVVLSI